MRNSKNHYQDIAAGMLSGVFTIFLSTAFTALIFRGPLSPYFSMGISCAIIGSCLINIITSYFSSFRNSISTVNPTPGVVLALVCMTAANKIAEGSDVLPTLLAILAISSLMVGLIIFLLGYFRLGQIVRFLPYPVMGGVIAGTAWAMSQASCIMLVNNDFSFNHLLQPTLLMQTFIACFSALFLLFTTKNGARPWMLPFFIFIASVAINVTLVMLNISHDDAIRNDWLFSTISPAFALQSMNISMFNAIHWPSIFSQFNYILIIVGIIIILLLLNISALETTLKQKVDLDKELKVTGLANVLAGLFAAAPAFISFPGTVLNHSSGAKNRLSGYVASIVCLSVLFLYPNIISYLPKPVIVGLIFYIALRLLIQWLYDGWKILPLVDYLIVIAILATVALSGFLNGVVVGIVITCFVFIVRYAKVDAILLSISGDNYHSNVIRPLHQQKWLAEKGKAIHLFKLQGFIFFGSAKLLLEKVTRLLDENKISFLMFDFHAVTGMDSSAIFSFTRLLQFIDDTKTKILFTGCSTNLLTQLQHQRGLEDLHRIIFFPDIDQGMEWCESQLLNPMEATFKPAETTFQKMLDQLIANKNQQAIFLKFLEEKDINANTYLFRQGDPSDCLYFIREGNVDVYLEDEESTLRVSKSGAGTIVGEIGFYLNTPRVASVFAETKCIVYKLTQQSIIELEQKHPDIALVFHKNIITTLAERIIQTNRELQLIAH